MEDKDYKEKNICPYCEGRIYLTYPPKSDRQGVKCFCDDGTYVGYLLHDIKTLNREVEDIKKEHKELKEWIKETSTCKTCGGDQYKTWGGCKCEECGLIGKVPWPG